MYLAAEDIKQWPELDALLRQLNLSVKPRVRTAFVRYAGSYGNLALVYSTPPRVVVDFDFFKCEDVGEPRDQGDGTSIQDRTMKMGFTPPSPKVGEIYVAPDIAMNADMGVDGTVAAEATVLHECIHWCRMMRGEDVWSETEPYAFEKEAYGNVVSRTYRMCFPQRVTK